MDIIFKTAVNENFPNLLKHKINHNREFEFKLYYLGSVFFRNEYLLKLKNYSLSKLENIIKYMDFGILILKFQDRIIIYNDLFGSYPLFYNINKNSNIEKVSNNIKLLIKELSYDSASVFDYYLFHHVVGNNTLFSDIKRVSGGCKIIITNSIILEKLADLNYTLKQTKPEIDSSKSIYSYIQGSLDKNKKTILTLTGGFDSRLLLGQLLKLKQNFNASTWGIKGNLQSEFAKDLSRQFNIPHTEINLDQIFINNLENYIEKLFELTPESAFILDMPQFLYFTDKLQELFGEHQIVTGFMGSEIIRSPSYSSEVLLTKFTADMSIINQEGVLSKTIEEKLVNSGLFKTEVVQVNLEKLSKRYKLYTKIGAKDNTSVVDYLFYEKYAKIYSQIIKLHENSDIVNPYLSIDFIAPFVQKYFINNNNDLYNTSVFQNFIAYRRYAKILKKSDPTLLHTKVDKGGYQINDLLTLQGNLKIIWKKYFAFSKNKRQKSYSPVINYQEWYKPLLLDSFSDPNHFLFDVIDFKKLKNQLDRYDQLDFVSKNSLIMLLGLYLHPKYVS